MTMKLALNNQILFTSVLKFPVFCAGKYCVVPFYMHKISLRKRKKSIHMHSHTQNSFFNQRQSFIERENTPF